MSGLMFKKRKGVQQVEVPDYGLIRDDQNSSLGKIILLGFGLFLTIRVLLDD